MNANLLAVVKQIVADQGEGILAEPRRVSAFFADLAKDEPKPQRYAFVRCLEHGFAQVLKNAPEQDRDACKQKLAQRLHDEEGLDRELCGESVELLAVVLFGEEQKKNDNLCKNCGQELQEGWKICPYCTAPVTNAEIRTSQVISSAISSGSGSAGYGINLIARDDSQISSESGSWGYDIEQIKPVSTTSDDEKISQAKQEIICYGCKCYETEYKEVKNKETNKKESRIVITCNYFNCDILEAAGYSCGMKVTDPDYETVRKKTKNIPGYLINLLGGIGIFISIFFTPVGFPLIGIALTLLIIKHIITGKRIEKAKRASP
jgi:hypothetical protein